MIVRQELKKMALEKLKPNWGLTIGVFVIYCLIIWITSYTYAGTLIVGGPLTVGLILFFIGLYKDEQPKIEILFDGFKKSFLNSMIAYILVSIFTFLWFLLFIVPGIIKGISYSMTFYIIAENPDISYSDAIKKSMELTNGYKMDIFVLYLSFLGWAILALLTFGIGYLLLFPYINMTLTNLYFKLKELKGWNTNLVQPDLTQPQG